MLARSEIKRSRIKVLTENGTVYLMGILTRAEADYLETMIRTVSGVTNVVKVIDYI